MKSVEKVLTRKTTGLLQNMHLIKSAKLNEDTKLYRYVSFRQFLDFVETKKTSLSRIKSWDDTWEVPSAKLPTQIDDGPIRLSFWNHCESMFGQCWSLHHESDAMWRIYSPQKEGVVIQTSVKKFSLMTDIKFAALGPVIYYNDLKVVMDEIYLHPGQEEYGRFTEGFLKRKAFEHEAEVRLVTADDTNCLVQRLSDGATRFYIDLDPLEFIQGITIDPRADERYVEVIQKYCERMGFTIQPAKSSLYSDPYKQTGLVRKFVTVKKAKRAEG